MIVVLISDNYYGKKELELKDINITMVLRLNNIIRLNIIIVLICRWIIVIIIVKDKL